MTLLDNCGYCGKPIEESTKTNGVTYAVCNRCNAILHPHCLKAHRLSHKNRDDEIKNASEDDTNHLITNVFSSIREIFSSHGSEKNGKR